MAKQDPSPADDAPPPTDHVIRPHQMLLLAILVLAFKDNDIKSFPSEVALHVHRVLLFELSEVSPPKSHQQILATLLKVPGVAQISGRTDGERAAIRFMEAASRVHNDMVTPDKMGNFLANIPSLIIAKTGDEPRFNRRSIFGYFCRRCYVTYVKLSFVGMSKLCDDFQAWCKGVQTAGYETVRKDLLTNDTFIYKTQADRKNWAKTDTFSAWEQALATGDPNVAEENLRRFFEQHFHDGNDSGVRQHALLNLVRMHYVQGEYVAVRNLLLEAINTARTSNDKVTLHHCTSILHRLPTTIPGQKPPIHEIQSDLHPLEVLFDVSKLLDEANEQPLSAAFIKLFQAMGLYDHWLDAQHADPVEDQQWAQHAVQSLVWRAAGCSKLADIEEDTVMAFTEPGSDSTNKLAVTLNRAYQTARQGKYDEGLSILLDPSAWYQLTLHDYVSWAHQIWHIMALRASRRGQNRLYREFLLPQRPAGPYNPKEYLFNVGWDGSSSIRDLLHRVLQLRECEQATAGVEHLLKALWHSEFLCRFNLYRTCVILLADIGLEFGISKRSRQMLEEILPQVIDGDDIEQRAVACHTFARCVIAAGDSTPSALQESLSYLHKAESDFKRLEMLASLADVQYTMSIVYHNLGRVDDALEVAERHAATLQEQSLLETSTTDQSVVSVFSIVDRVGVHVATPKGMNGR